MTRRERVMTAIKHKEADRIPKGELAIEEDLLNRLLGKNCSENVSRYVKEKEVRELLNIDLVNLGVTPCKAVGTDREGNIVYLSVYGEEYIATKRGRHLIKPALSDIEDAEKYKVPDINFEGHDTSMITNFVNNTDLFIFGGVGGPITKAQRIFGMEDYMCYCLTNTKEIRM